jgi:hypothetical protein
MEMISELAIEPQRGHHPTQVVEVTELQGHSPVAAGNMNHTAYCDTPVMLVRKESEESHRVNQRCGFTAADSQSSWMPQASNMYLRVRDTFRTEETLVISLSGFETTIRLPWLAAMYARRIRRA